MLTPEQQAAMLDALHRVINRESDREHVLNDEQKVMMKVERLGYSNDIGIYLRHHRLDLEPDPEDIPPDGA